MTSNQVGSIRTIDSDTASCIESYFTYGGTRVNRDHSVYVAYNNAYATPIKISDGVAISDLEKKYQKAERNFHKLINSLKEISYLDDNDPIVTYRVNPEVEKSSMFFWLSPGSVLLEFSLLSGAIRFNFTIDKLFVNDKQKAITHLSNLREQIISEIVNQGYPVENKHISNLITLNINKPLFGLVGGFKDWTPYVCAGVPLKKLSEILLARNNPDYNATGEVRINVATAIALSSMHESFATQLVSS